MVEITRDELINIIGDGTGLCDADCVKNTADAILARLGDGWKPFSEALKPNLEEPEWITWSGGECPVGSDTVVEVQFKGGAVDVDYASEMDWQWDGDGHDHTFDVIKYRVQQ